MMSSNVIAHSSCQNSSIYASCSYKTTSLKRAYVLKRVQETYKKFQERPLPPVFKSRLDGPSVTWRIFSRLQMAIGFADSSTSGCMVFSFEEKVGNAGQRLFLVATPQKMWVNHRTRHVEDRCTYEIIRENCACKLYFDLEFYTSLNPEKNGNLLTNIFIKCVIASMYEQHNFLLKESDFLWLDASNEQKFSSHLILQMDGVAFKDNIHAGIFVSFLSSSLKKRMEENAPSDKLWPCSVEIKSLVVKSKKENEIFLHDEGVYTKNRNFRMYLSTKQRKKSPLILSHYNKYTPYVSPGYKEEAIFYDSLITYFRNRKPNKLLSYDEITQADILSNSSARRKRDDQPGISGCSSSPFPELDNFVLTIIRDDIAVGFIRKWTYLNNEQKMVYDIGNYRYCGNIRRHHRSNNISITIDMKMRCYYQKCLDPECRQMYYRSEASPLPDNVLFVNVPDDFFDSNCFSQLPPVESKTENIHCTSTDFSEKLSNSCASHNFESVVSKSREVIPCDDNVNRTFSNNDETWQVFPSNCDDFSELNSINNVTSEEIPRTLQQNGTRGSGVSNTEDWDAFFVDDFPCTQELSAQNQNENVNEDFSFLDVEDSWNAELEENDSAVSLGSVSFEEEMLMAEAAGVFEATFKDSIFSEETLF